MSKYCSIDPGLSTHQQFINSARLAHHAGSKGARSLHVVSLDDAMHDRDGRTRYLVHRDISQSERGGTGHREEEEVASLEGERKGLLVHARGGLREGSRAKDEPGLLVPLIHCAENERGELVSRSESSVGSFVLGGGSEWVTNLRTTTMGLSVFVIIPSPFHIISAVEITAAKLSAWSKT